MATYEVTYLARHYPIGVDGVAAGLRVCQDDEYLQFFLPMVSGIDLVSTTDLADQSDEWWRALVQLGIAEITLCITQGGFEPSDDPTIGRLLPIPAVRIEQHLADGGALPELTDGLLAGHTVATFDSP